MGAPAGHRPVGEAVKAGAGDDQECVWGSYVLRRTSDRERLLASERESRGCALMTMYKSTGKEFDGVVLIEGKYRSPSASVGSEEFDRLEEENGREGEKGGA